MLNPRLVATFPLLAGLVVAGAMAQAGEVSRTIGYVVSLVVAVTAAVCLVYIRQIRTMDEAHARRSRFVSVAVHEIRTALTPLRVHAHLLRSEGLPSSQERSVATIERNVERLVRLTSDVLDVSRSESGEVAFTAQPTSVSSLVTEAQALHAAQARAAGIALEVEARDDDVVVRADPARLEQVLSNLVSNAIKNTPTGGTVRVAVATDATHAFLRVVDTGVGIVPDDVDRLFRPFSRLAPPDGLPREGTGLGLFFCRTVVEQHGGRIWCESGGVGMGATFAFTLPLEGGPQAGLPVTSRAWLAKPVARLRSMSIRRGASGPPVHADARVRAPPMS